MKTQPSRRKDGFTLVELLVVITIIAVLAGAGFAAGTAAIQKAKKTTALATVTSIESAVNNYYNEYGSMPIAANTDAEYTTAKGGSAIPILTTLCGLETNSAPLNPRAVKFLSVREGKGGKNGINYNTTGSAVESITDPWGGPYKMMLDLDYDERVTVSPKNDTSRTLNGRRVAAWSEGADYAGAAKPADDVKNF